jgi:hypothetical protein
VGRRAGGFELAFEVDAQGLLLQAGQAGRVELAALGHLGQHGVAPGQRPLGVEHRVVVAVALEHAHQGGASSTSRLRAGLSK